MNLSKVGISLADDNGLGCSYAVIEKSNASVILVLKDAECAAFDYDCIRKKNFDFEYLLLKHYADEKAAYKDFLKLIGKMCAKRNDSKYFGNYVEENNRMVFRADGICRMIKSDEYTEYEKRFTEYKNFILNNRDRFDD